MAKRQHRWLSEPLDNRKFAVWHSGNETVRHLSKSGGRRWGRGDSGDTSLPLSSQRTQCGYPGSLVSLESSESRNLTLGVWWQLREILPGSPSLRTPFWIPGGRGQRNSRELSENRIWTETGKWLPDSLHPRKAAILKTILTSLETELLS